MLEMKHVKDFSGKLILSSKARKIGEHYYEEGVTCILMPDGQWYRTTTDKIRFDWEKKKWFFTKDTENLAKGLVDDGSIGYFTPTEENVRIAYKKDTFLKQTKVDIFGQQNIEETTETRNTWIKTYSRTSSIAVSFGFVESIYDGIFYKANEMNATERNTATKPNTPAGERTNVYSLEDDQTKEALIRKYEAYSPVISKGIKKLASYVPYTFGGEFETSIGFVPARLRGNLGVKPLRDGSISGIEYVTIPLEGAKGINTIYELCAELTKRADLNLQCSVHFHFGNVRRDKLYILSLWTLAEKIQDELLSIFPYSRVNSIRPDGKVYCKPLPNLDMKTSSLFKTKNREEFQETLNGEFNKIYAFLNNNHKLGEVTERKRIKKEGFGILAGKQTKVWKLATKTYCFSTKVKTHSIRGHKWDRPQRYYWLNLLPTFFSNAETIEFRPHEATLNFEKSIMWMLICVAILKYAEKIKHCITEKKITLSEVIQDYYPSKISEHILGYCDHRFTKFHRTDGTYKSNWEDIEGTWIAEDKKFKFKNMSIIDLW